MDMTQADANALLKWRLARMEADNNPDKCVPPDGGGDRALLISKSGKATRNRLVRLQRRIQ